MHVPHIDNLLALLSLDPDAPSVLVWPYAASSQRRGLDGSAPAPPDGGEEWSAILAIVPGMPEQGKVTFANGAPSLVGAAALAFLEGQGPLRWEYRSLDSLPAAPSPRGLLPPVPPWKHPRETGALPPSPNPRPRSDLAEANWVPTLTRQGQLVRYHPQQLSRALRQPLLLIDGARTVQELAWILWRQLPEGDALERVSLCLQQLLDKHLIS